MKIAAQTVLWGNRIHSVVEILEILARFGCQGVEFSQGPDQLGTAIELRKLLADFGLSLVGLSGGTLRDRIQFCGDILRPDYLYVEDWDPGESENAISAGFNLALHPHLFKPVHRLEDAALLLQQKPRLMYLPDTAHLTISGDSIPRAIRDWGHRLAAVHLKDWTPIYGRSSHRYARGFVELGRGCVNFEILFSRLKEIKYDGWLVFEQGSPDSSPEMVIHHATKWLSKQIEGTLISKPLATKKVKPVLEKLEVLSTGFTIASAELKKIQFLNNYTTYLHEQEKEFLNTMFRAAVGDVKDYYPELTEALGKFLNAKLIILCACSPTADMMGILGVYPSNTPIKRHFMHYRKSLSSVGVERQAITEFDLTLVEPGKAYGRSEAKFGYPELVKQLNLRKLISVPVLNPYNPHQARFVLNFFPADGKSAPSNDTLARHGRLLAQAADAALDERCALAAATASVRAGDCQQSKAFLGELLQLFQETLDCKAITIFLANDIGDRLEVADTTGVIWSVPASEEFYRMGEGLVGRVWQRREPILTPDPQRELGSEKEKSDEHGRLPENMSFLCAPMFDMKGVVVGVVRCQNKKTDAGSFRMFSEDDLAVFDAVCQSAVPHLQVLLSKERRAKALRRMSHELQNPIVALRGAADRMKRELVKLHGTSESFFTEDYVGDIEGWIGLMRGLLGNADFFRLSDRILVLEQKRIHLYGDVFMPAVKQIQELLLDRHFSEKNIIVSKFDDIPRMWIDKYRLTQVVFNLLSNAIKYAHEDPESFKIVVTSQETENHYEINFSDYGPGIDDEMKEAVFLEGVRSKEAEQRDVAGDGLGLWVARRLIDAHGGRLTLAKCARPTTFKIEFPKWLKNRKRNLLSSLH